MYLKSLEIAGFKSFAKKSSFQFTAPISSIVGPNGSGKSNVAEAFRFVLGEQSIKSLRGKRGEDLIFNGGGDGTRVNRAAVKLVFDNAKRLLNVDFDEVVIERVVHRDSANEYFINGSPVRLKDIIELLAGAHIGASGHHIISQGEADRILNANIRERREMIEDALGLKVYHYKKQESERKLEKTEENMKSVESLRRELAPHLKFLKKQVEKVEKTREMKDELRALYREYFKREDIYIKKTRTEIDTERKGPTEELAVLDQELATSKKIIEASATKDAKSEEVIALDRELATARFEKDTLVREIGTIEGEINAARRTILREREKQARDDSKTVYLKDVEVVVQKMDGLSSIGDVRELFVKIKELFNSFIATHKTTVDMRAISELEQDIVRLENEKSSNESALATANQKTAELNRTYEALKLTIEKEKDSNRDAEKAMFKIIARQNELRGIISTLNARHNGLVVEEEAFKRELQEAYVIVGREAVDYVNIVVETLDESRAGQEERRRRLEKLKIRIEDAGGAISTDEVMREFKETEERDAFLAKEIIDLETAKASLLTLIADLDARLDVEFKQGILKINTQFQHFFALMFGGGTAGLNVIREKKRKRRLDTDLSLGDEIPDDMQGVDEEGEEGIDITVNLPRKKVKGLMMLSGGERALTSIALLFAISQVNPPPFIILDETDAALDEANSRKYGDMITSLSEYSQLILITHNRETMSRAGILYGVTMGSDGSSKLLSLQFEEAVKVAK